MKRQAYRSRRREQRSMPKPSKAKRQDWQKEQAKSNKKYKEEKRQKQQQEHRSKVEGRRENLSTIRDSEWENLLSRALQISDFESLQHLFVLNLKQCSQTEEGTSRKLLTRRYRELSVRFHPDKHMNDIGLYKVAFQALNEARQQILNTSCLST